MKTAADLFKSAEKQANRGSYSEALQTLSKLKHEFSYSDYIPKAELLRGDIYFDQMEWEQAEKAYKSFLDLYPAHKSKEYALFRRILSWKKQIPSVATRDVSLSEKALGVISEFLKHYPKGKYTEQVTKIRSDIYDLLAQKELKIAQFYFKKNKHSKATLKRLDKVIEKYPRWRLKALKLALRTAEKLEDQKLINQYQLKMKRFDRGKLKSRKT